MHTGSHPASLTPTQSPGTLSRNAPLNNRLINIDIRWICTISGKGIRVRRPIVPMYIRESRLMLTSQATCSFADCCLLSLLFVLAASLGEKDPVNWYGGSGRCFLVRYDLEHGRLRTFDYIAPVRDMIRTRPLRPPVNTC
jgi:hypothetical protein